MTHRERFNNLFYGKHVDRVPFIDYMGQSNFRSCIPRWKTEGLAADADDAEVRRIVGFDYIRGYKLNMLSLFYPEFNVEFVRREGDRIYMRNKWGGLEINREGSIVMPMTLEGVVKDRDGWERVRDRLTGGVGSGISVGGDGVAGRFSDDFDDLCAEAADSDLPVHAGGLPAGFFGGPREILGLENLIYLFYDDPNLLEEILDTLCELWIDMCKYIMRRVTLDYYFIWEDMCGKTGPLISPDMFRQFLLPRYKRWTGALRQGGCRHISVDSDGDVRELVPLWMEGGVNLILPWESQFGLDLRDVRKQYPTLGIIGGLNKRVLEFDRAEMDKELDKLPYLLESGYFIPSCDHGVTNDVPWSNYLYFYDRLRELIYRHPPNI